MSNVQVDRQAMYLLNVLRMTLIGAGPASSSGFPCRGCGISDKHSGFRAMAKMSFFSNHWRTNRGPIAPRNSDSPKQTRTQAAAKLPAKAARLDAQEFQLASCIMSLSRRTR